MYKGLSSERTSVPSTFCSILNARFFALFALGVLTFISLTQKAVAQDGTLAEPFTDLAQVPRASTSGRYYFNLGSGTFQADVDMSTGSTDGAWVLVLQYLHKGGLNSNLTTIGAGTDLPILSTSPLGTDESGVASKWGHAGNAAMAQFTGDLETRFYATTSNHSRKIHFYTDLGDDYMRTGTGNFSGIQSGYSLLGGHTAHIPANANLFFSNKGDQALTNFPFYKGAAYHWGIKGNGNRYEVDNFTGSYLDDTSHKVWVRAKVDRGGPVGSCAYVQNFDGDMPFYDSSAVYAPRNMATLSGIPLAATSTITSDASGSGKFILYNTGPEATQYNGVIFGSPDPITVTPNQYYKFKFKLANHNGINREVIQPRINGVNVGGPVSTSTTGSWETFEVIWHSGPATTAKVELYNNNGSSTGNDFALDEVSFCAGALYDRSDAPTSGTNYGEALHLGTGTYVLGTDWGLDLNPVANADASGDVSDDGVIVRALTQDITSYFDVDVSGTDGYLQGWIDWNGDGDFDDSGEQIVSDLQDNGLEDWDATAGIIRIGVRSPANATASSFARFRWSSQSGLTTAAPATNGEVEDYAITVNTGHSATAQCQNSTLNFALNGTATQSSTGWSGIASRAIDGNTNGLWGSGTITHTSNELAPWWELDLGQSYPIDHIKLWKRIDCCWDRSDDFYLFASETPFTTTANADDELFAHLEASIFKFQFDGSPSTTTEIGVQKSARYIRVTLPPRNNFLSLAELQVFGCTGELAGEKTIAIWDPTNADLYAVPGNDVIYTITAKNTGAGEIDSGSIFLVDDIPVEVEFYNGDIDDGGPETNAVSFTQSSGAGLTFTYATDVGFSNSTTAPIDFANCNYTPTVGYDPNVTFVCFNPKGALATGDPDPEFSVSFRAQIK